ncbi:hypothetical protein HG535_0H03460 [Zygotorulaspora mrakii]|uniref:Activator of Hsp90 ATPase AHSA1-like N-terminal domain-containing protein n=1 Tax=Zygotorulaspora mrakii TaxID=42260 RepID=A0A7H9BAG8_ZYGMR|nr:uncharacterized protein HG535_0H03460 [Zygotorulaspora mrakii]QLG75019.1 hypothetical protein HG535_0H03460 [Zygotorulaspora mrakii]
MVVLNPNNWHWVDKNTLPWTKAFFQDRLSDLTVVSNDSKHEIKITSVSNVSGDSNVSQRKGQPICYFDLQLSFAVQVAELETEKELSSGTISIPEFMHDERDFEVQYQSFDSFLDLIKLEFYPRVYEILLQYQPALIEEHSKDLKHNQ